MDSVASLAEGISPIANVSQPLATTGSLPTSSNLPNLSSSDQPSEAGDGGSRISIPQVIGATIGVVSLIAILLACITYLMIRRRRFIRTRETSTTQ